MKEFFRLVQVAELFPMLEKIENLHQLFTRGLTAVTPAFQAQQSAQDGTGAFPDLLRVANQKAVQIVLNKDGFHL